MDAKKYVILSKDLQCNSVTLTELVNLILAKKIPEGAFITLSVAIEDNNRLVYKYSAKVYANSKKLKLVSIITNESIIYTLKKRNNGKRNKSKLLKTSV